MVRILASLLMCLLLAACFESARFDIPAFEKVQPEGLAGRYWNIADAPGRLGIEEFAFTPDGGVTWTRRESEAGGNAAEESEADEQSWPARLIRLTDSGSYLFILDLDEDDFQYMLLERQANGVWVMSDPSLDDEWPFDESNLLYAQSIAARYGMLLKSGEADRIEGTVNAENVFGLFRDPDFLGALNVEVYGIFVPMHSDQQIPEEFDADLGSARAAFLGLNGYEVALPGAALPEAFAGTYVYSSPFELVDLQFVRVNPMDDGTYEVRRGPDELYRLLLVPTGEGKDPVFGLKIMKYTSPDGSNSRLDVNLIYIERGDSGWTLWPIEVRNRPTLPALEDMQFAMMKRAAQRHGLDFDGGSINGVSNAGQLRNLMGDGQFISGLTVNRDQVARFFSGEGVRRGLDEANFPDPTQ